METEANNFRQWRILPIMMALPMTSATYFLNTVSRDYLACKLRRSVSSSIQSLFFQAPTCQ
jgi:hypothetical protein